MTTKSLRDVVSGIKWRSADRDNMEFEAKITYVQRDALNAALDALAAYDAADVVLRVREGVPRARLIEIAARQVVAHGTRALEYLDADDMGAAMAHDNLKAAVEALRGALGPEGEEGR